MPFAVEELASLALDLDTPADVVALTRELERARVGPNEQQRRWEYERQSRPWFLKIRAERNRGMSRGAAIVPVAGVPEIAEGAASAS